MKRWIAVVCVAVLVGCARPQISVTDASPRGIGFLVKNAWLVPMQDVDERAASHCQLHGLTYRQTDAVWISSTSRRVAYACDGATPLPTPKPEVRRARVRAVRAAAAEPTAADPKVKAWTKAKAATDAWALCLRFDAERKAKATAQSPQSIAQDVVGACSGLEHAVHEPLMAVGEDSSRFQADLHAQAVQNAADTVTSVRFSGAQ